MVPIDIKKNTVIPQKIIEEFSPIVGDINDDKPGSNYWFAVIDSNNQYKITAQKNIKGLLLARSREVGELFVFPGQTLVSLTKEKAYIIARDLDLSFLFVYYQIGSSPIPYKVKE